MASVLNPGQSLRPGESLVSANYRFKLFYQSDGNLALYDWDPVYRFEANPRSLWGAGTERKAAGCAVMQDDGNFVIYSPTYQPWWSTGTHGQGGHHVVMQDDGNLVVYTLEGKPLWGSGTNLSGYTADGKPIFGASTSTSSGTTSTLGGSKLLGIAATQQQAKTEGTSGGGVNIVTKRTYDRNGDDYFKAGLVLNNVHSYLRWMAQARGIGQSELSHARYGRNHGQFNGEVLDPDATLLYDVGIQSGDPQTRFKWREYVKAAE